MSTEIARSITRSDIEAALARAQPLDKAVEAALYDAVDLIRSGGTPDPVLFSTIAASAVSFDKGLGEWVSPVIAALTELYPDACAIILALASSTRASARLCAIYSLSPKLDDAFLAGVLETLIEDEKSTKVRIAAADWITRHYKRQFLETLRKALQRESNVKVRDFMVMELALLEHGYVVRRSHNDSSITARGEMGLVSLVLQDGFLEGRSDHDIFAACLPELRDSMVGELVGEPAVE